EVWPNLVAACQQMGVPLVLANARLSEKSLRNAQRLAWLARPTFAALSAVWAQTPLDAQRLQSLGARVTGVMGNLKFDATPDAGQLATGRAWRAQLAKPVVMFASSRDGEERALLEILGRARRDWIEGGPPAKGGESVGAAPSPRWPDGGATIHPEEVHWLIVPRHPQRFDEVAVVIESHGYAVQRRSSWGQGGPVEMAAGKPSIWLGDSLGEMALYYGLADVALLGGSFEPLGGQNLIEAAACGCPVVMGPHTFNFLEAAEQALAAGAAQRVADLGQAVAGLGALLREDTLANARLAAKRFAQSHQGAAQRLAVAVVRGLMD
ncbi:MAG TPA: glycosyltransferase N-terminal domain-containing protein, partial [Rhodoferax sp.]|nr:glycosyltransferase N-terminal domain-containing protein [Rhodoferax sp.]